MNTVQHKFDKSRTTVAACRPYYYISYVNPRFIWNTNIGPPAVLQYCVLTWGNFIVLPTHPIFSKRFKRYYHECFKVIWKVHSKILVVI